MTGRRRAALLFLLAAACGRGGEAPRLEVAAESSTGGPVVAARFRVRNGGGAPLHLHAVVPDCACDAAIGSGTLAAGEETVVAARCRAVPGASTVRRLRLRSNDPARPWSELTVALPAAEAAGPPALAFGYVRVGDVLTREVAGSSGAGAVRLAGASDAFTLEPSGARGYRVRFAPRAPGVARAVLERGAGLPSTPVVGVGFAALVPYPAEIGIPSGVAPDLPPVFLQSLADAPVAITRVEFPPDLAGDVRTIVPGTDFRLTLRRTRVSEAAAGADARGDVRIYTDADGGGPVVLPVRRRPVPGASP